MHLPYRQDIDGLRAFAVSSVVIFHAFPALIPGGFIGVDVFFVISGFLISGIIFRELEAGEFSFANFYARRVKRIFPALITVLLCVYAFGWFYLFTDDFRRLGSHIFRASLFLSNFILWREAGYFDNAAETKPLLHLWSLGIEEQFYIVWPLILWASWRVRMLRWRLVSVLIAASFVWNLYQAQNDLTHDFYSPLTRFWELASGAALAYWGMRGQPLQASVANRLSILAGLMLGVGIFAIQSKMAFPGGWAVVPVLGAVLLISAGPQACVNRLILSHPLAVGVGVISYPLYLWHWPALALARIVEGTTPSVALRLSLVFVSVALAWLTYRCVERPIRFIWKSPFKTLLLVLAMAGVGAIGLACKNAGGYAQRAIVRSQVASNDGDIGHEVFHAYYGKHFVACADQSIYANSEKWGTMVRCFQTHANKPLDMVLVGDSHAEHLLLGLSQALPHLNIAVYPRSELPFAQSDEYKDIFASIERDTHVRIVVLTAMWAVAPLSSSEQQDFEKQLMQTLKKLTDAGKQVVLMGDTPKFGFDPQRCKYSHPLTGQSHCVESVDSFMQTSRSYSPLLQSAAAAVPNVHYVNMDDVFCDASSCYMAKDGQILFRDTNHVNVLGSQILGKALAQRLQ